jgi:hypothetical protein
MAHHSITGCINHTPENIPFTFRYYYNFRLETSRIKKYEFLLVHKFVNCHSSKFILHLK